MSDSFVVPYPLSMRSASSLKIQLSCCLLLAHVGGAKSLTEALRQAAPRSFHQSLKNSPKLWRALPRILLRLTLKFWPI